MLMRGGISCMQSAADNKPLVVVCWCCARGA
jgi:hypothetical protein